MNQSNHFNDVFEEKRPFSMQGRRSVILLRNNIFFHDTNVMQKAISELE